MARIADNANSGLPQLTLGTIIASLVASVGLTATCSFASGYLAALQHLRAEGQPKIDTSGTMELSDSFVSVGALEVDSEATGQQSSKGKSKAADIEADKQIAAAEADAAKTHDEEKPYQRVKVEYSKLYKGWPCGKDERLFQNMCYVDCGKATGGSHPYRVDSCTCCKEVPCVQLAGRFTKNCQQLDMGDDARQPIPPPLPNCHTQDEELFMGLCYKKCSVLTKERYPIRTGMNTCSKSIFGGNWTMGIGPCSGFGIGGDNCLPHIPLPTGMGYNAKGEPGYPPIGFGYLSGGKNFMPLLQRPR